MAKRAEYKKSFTTEDRIELLCRAIEWLAGIVKDTHSSPVWHQDGFKVIDELLKLAKED